MSEKIILYWNLGSQPARAVKTLLDIGQIPYQLVQKDVVKEQTRSKQFLEINPFGQIPFLVHGKFKIAESNAILIYLCETFKSIPDHFYGKTPEQRAITNQYISWYQYYFRPALFKIIKLKIYGFVRKNETFKSYQLVSAKKQMIEAIKTLNDILKRNNTKFICGNDLTIADLLIFFELTNIYYYGEKIDELKELSKWFENVYNLKQVNKITHEWFPMSKQISKVLSGIKPVDEPPKSSL